MVEMPPGHFELASKTGFSAKSAAAAIAAILA
jgi:hypothetical protein